MYLKESSVFLVSILSAYGQGSARTFLRKKNGIFRACANSVYQVSSGGGLGMRLVSTVTCFTPVSNTLPVLISPPTISYHFQHTARDNLEGSQWWGGKDWSLDYTTIYFPCLGSIQIHWWYSLYMAAEMVPAHSAPHSIDPHMQWSSSSRVNMEELSI